MVAGAASEVVISLLEKLPVRLRNKMEEINIDVAGSINAIARKCFPNAVLVTDRFHVQQLASEVFKEMRIKHRWEAIDRENEAIEKVRKNKKAYRPVVFENGDTIKQLLARSRYVLYKNEIKWTADQKRRAEIYSICIRTSSQPTTYNNYSAGSLKKRKKKYTPTIDWLNGMKKWLNPVLNPSTQSPER